MSPAGMQPRPSSFTSGLPQELPSYGIYMPTDTWGNNYRTIPQAKGTKWLQCSIHVEPEYVVCNLGALYFKIEQASQDSNLLLANMLTVNTYQCGHSSIGQS